MKSVELELSKIRIDGGTQPRAKIDMETVADYHAAFEHGANFPPIDVFFDGKEYWLADGFHRWHGARAANLDSLDVIVHKGTVRDAILFAVGANASHGLRRTNQDKRQAVEMLLGDEEWAKWSNRSIAEKCGVSDPFVASIREKVQTVSTFPTEVKYTTSTGKTATMPVKPKADPVQPSSSSPKQDAEIAEPVPESRERAKVERKACDIPDSAIVGSHMSCPTCGQKWPEGKAFHG